MEIGKCKCNHAAISYRGIDRHYFRLPTAQQVYSDYCQEPDCRCERAMILHIEPTPEVQREKTKWARMVAEVLG